MQHYTLMIKYISNNVNLINLNGTVLMRMTPWLWRSIDSHWLFLIKTSSNYWKKLLCLFIEQLSSSINKLWFDLTWYHLTAGDPGYVNKAGFNAQVRFYSAHSSHYNVNMTPSDSRVNNLNPWSKQQAMFTEVNMDAGRQTLCITKDSWCTNQVVNKVDFLQMCLYENCDIFCVEMFQRDLACGKWVQYLLRWLWGEIIDHILYARVLLPLGSIGCRLPPKGAWPQRKQRDM